MKSRNKASTRMNEEQEYSGADLADDIERIAGGYLSEIKKI